MRGLKVGIVGAAEDKFTVYGRLGAMGEICDLLVEPDSVLVSGGCHLGGIDIWAEVIADALSRQKIIHKPATLSWSAGYKPRNLKIAHDCDVCYSLVAASYPPNYAGMRFPRCYHCLTDDHVKSGGCWTAKQAYLLGKPAFILAIGREGELVRTRQL